MTAKILSFPERRGQIKIITVTNKDQLMEAAIQVAKEQNWTEAMITHLIREMSLGDAVDATEIFEADFSDVARVNWV